MGDRPVQYFTNNRTKPPDEDGFVARFSWQMPMTTANRKSSALTSISFYFDFFFAVFSILAKEVSSGAPATIFSRYGIASAYFLSSK